MTASPEGTHLEPPKLGEIAREMRAHAHKCRVDATNGLARFTDCRIIEAWANAIEEARTPRPFTKEETTALNIALGAFKILMEAPRPVMPQRHAEAHAIIARMLDSSKGGET